MMSETFNLPIRRKLSDYSQEEIAVLNKMHSILSAYNAALGTNNELPLPSYSNNEMSAYSIYRELLIGESSED
jgi:hypothetical protein